MNTQTKLTLLLPIKDRPQYTKRCLAYLNQAKCSFPVFIADGSLSNTTQESYAQETFPRLNIDYQRFAPDKNFQAFMLKMKIALERIDTPYIVWACDDDFYDLDELAKGVEFLKEHPDYVSYTGKILNFSVNPDKAKRGQTHHGKICLGDSNFSMNTCITEKSTSERLNNFHEFKPYEAIQKTKVSKKVFELAVKWRITHIHQLTMITKLLLLHDGKAFASDEVFLLRQYNTPSSAGKTILNQGNNLVFVTENEYFNFTINILLKKILPDLVSNHSERLEVENSMLRYLTFFYDLHVKKFLRTYESESDVHITKLFKNIIKKLSPPFMLKLYYCLKNILCSSNHKSCESTDKYKISQDFLSLAQKVTLMK